MKITIDRATVTKVEQDSNTGFHSMLSFRKEGWYIVFSLPMKLNIGDVVAVKISVQNAKELQVVDNEEVKSA